MKNRKLNWAIGILTVIGLALPATYIAVEYYQDHRYERDSFSRRISDDLYTTFNNDNDTYDVVSAETEEIVGTYNCIYSVYESLDEEKEISLIEAVTDGGSIFIDASTGQPVDSLGTFNCVGYPNADTGYVVVADSNDMLGFINVFTREKISTDLKFDSDFDYEYLNGYFTANDEDFGSYLYNNAGDTLLSIPEGTITAYDSEGGMVFVVDRKNSVSVLDENLEEQLGTGFNVLREEDDYDYDSEDTHVLNLYKDSEFYTYDISARVLTKKSQIGRLIKVYEAVEETFQEGEIYSRTERLTEYYINGFDYEHYGVVDSELNVLIPAIYENIEYLGNGLFECYEPNGVYQTDYINVKK